jgi:hypothetical protein
MNGFLIPGGLYKIYYRRSSKKKKQPEPLLSYKAFVILISFGGHRIYRHQDLQGESPKKNNFTYEAVEMEKNYAGERFTISPGDIVKYTLLKRLKDMRDWPLEAVRVHFSRRGVGKDHIDELYNRDIQLADIDFGRFQVRAALKQRRNNAKLVKRQQAKKQAAGVWIDAEYIGLCEDGYINFRLTVGDLEPANYRFGKNSGIDGVVYRSDEHSVNCHNEEGSLVHRMSPQWSPEMVHDALERQQRTQEVQESEARGGMVFSSVNYAGGGNWSATSSTTS